ncbi:MAG: hypothetical protein NVSMB33_12920 [Ktedonobacteraceae bacterium]
MSKDSLETLLSRHYGSTAATPVGLEDRLRASVRQRAEELHAEQQMVAQLRHKRVSRRRAVRLVAISTAGLGVLSAGLEVFEAAFSSSNDTQQAQAFS